MIFIIIKRILHKVINSYFSLFETSVIVMITQRTYYNIQSYLQRNKTPRYANITCNKHRILLHLWPADSLLVIIFFFRILLSNYFECIPVQCIQIYHTYLE